MAMYAIEPMVDGAARQALTRLVTTVLGVRFPDFIPAGHKVEIPIKPCHGLMRFFIVPEAGGGGYEYSMTIDIRKSAAPELTGRWMEPLSA